MAIPTGYAALAAVFASAKYEIPELGEAGSIHVGTDARQLHAALGAKRYAFITAWNPDSQLCTQADNDRHDAELAALLGRLRVRRLRAHAADAQGGHYEQGWLVLNLWVEDLDRLARRFGQAGVLCWMPGQAVRLRLYHRLPVDAACVPWTDWAG